ncbi:hypothetical protein [Photobacterium sp. TLY01]|nr:hypothetical protein [Photobacterium sp. TLY01]
MLEVTVGCCNQPPDGGSNNIGLLVKATLALAVVIALLVAFFG